MSISNKPGGTCTALSFYDSISGYSRRGHQKERSFASYFCPLLNKLMICTVFFFLTSTQGNKRFDCVEFERPVCWGKGTCVPVVCVAESVSLFRAAWGGTKQPRVQRYSQNLSHVRRKIQARSFLHWLYSEQTRWLHTVQDVFPQDTWNWQYSSSVSLCWGKLHRFWWNLTVSFALMKEPQGDVIHQFADREHWSAQQEPQESSNLKPTSQKMFWGTDFFSENFSNFSGSLSK